MAVMANITACNPGLRIAKRDAAFNTSALARDPRCDVLHGHFRYENIPPGAVRFTFARHPIARLASCFYSVRLVLRKCGITSVADLRTPMVDFTFVGGIRLRRPRQDLLFLDTIEGFIDEFLRTQGTFNLGLIPEIFRPDYTKPYDFIGITERMPESIVALGRLIKTDASKMALVNASNSGPVHYRLKELQAFYGEELQTYERLAA